MIFSVLAIFANWIQTCSLNISNFTIFDNIKIICKTPWTTFMKMHMECFFNEENWREKLISILMNNHKNSKGSKNNGLAQNF